MSEDETFDCDVCLDGTTIQDTCDDCGERHCPSCDQCDPTVPTDYRDELALAAETYLRLKEPDLGDVDLDDDVRQGIY
jgi:hypothetical protein